jgi:diamine N-acetyltransferase
MIAIQKVNVDQLDNLLAFSKKTFYDFFAHLNEPANMEAYAAVAFAPENMLQQLANPDSHFYFAMVGDRIIGYLKLNFNDAQTEYKDKNALEVERIYVSAEHHGKQIGKQLLNFAFEIAKERRFAYVWLGVWDQNENAIGFYKHNGFEFCGSHPFLLGEDKQLDLLMRKTIV